MSYYCEICFKEIDGNDVFEFLQRFKTEITNHLEDIAADNFLYSPFCKAEIREDSSLQKKMEVLDATRTWASAYVFNFRYFYLKEQRLLGVFSVHKSLHSLFDACISFQDSCDQDYDYSYWNGIKTFEMIAEKGKTASIAEVQKAYRDNHYGDELTDEEADSDYYRKSLVYDTVWKMVGGFLENDSSALYLTLYGSYEAATLGTFARTCQKKAEDWYKEL